MDDNNENNDDNLEENISYEAYKLLLEAQKEKEMNDIAENQNLTIQEKIISYNKFRKGAFSVKFRTKKYIIF